MIFSEIYGAYYNTVAAIISEAVSHPVSNEDIRKIIEKHAFGESILTIPEAINTERWQLIKPDGTTPIEGKPTLPLSTLQKRWLKAVACDPRIKLFGDVNFDFPDVEPLFLPEDIIVFDKYSDGDNYEDGEYISNFRLITDAIKNRYPIKVITINRKGESVCSVLIPDYLEYSEKDDKFRLIAPGHIINLGRIVKCKKSNKPFDIGRVRQSRKKTASVSFELSDERNALERVLLHFAHFEKSVERIDEDRYFVTIKYDNDDETEMLIRILSFGPMIKVTAPGCFIDLIKQRLLAQKSCGQ